MPRIKKGPIVVEPSTAAPPPYDGPDVSFFSPVEITASPRLLRPYRKQVLEQWSKAAERLDRDASGAITAARALLETTCFSVLDETKTPFDKNADLPKLYLAAATALGVSAVGQKDGIIRPIFGAASTLVHSVAEMRNRLGDAHGKAQESTLASRIHAELAVNVAGSVSAFLIATLESHLAATKRLDMKGNVILRFDKTAVWRLRDHANNAPKSLPAYGQKRPKPALWLVGDAGIYLMSNGQPALSYSGDLIDPANKKRVRRLVAHADGCSQEDEFDDWWPLHNAVAGGDDFCFPIPIKAIDAALANAEKQIVVIAGDEKYWAVSDTDYDGGIVLGA